MFWVWLLLSGWLGYFESDTEHLLCFLAFRDYAPVILFALNCWLQGYWKKKCRLLEPILSDSAKGQVKEAEADLHDKVLTEVRGNDDFWSRVTVLVFALVCWVGSSIYNPVGSKKKKPVPKKPDGFCGTLKWGEKEKRKRCLHKELKMFLEDYIGHSTLCL